MNKLLFVFAAAAALAACDNSDHTIVTGPGDPNAAPVDTSNVVLPPSIASSKVYRCKDNSVVHIDWLSDNLSANFRTAQGATPVHLVAPAAGEPMVAEGYSLTGEAAAASITLERPGIGAQVCKA